MAVTFLRGLPHSLPLHVNLYFLITAAASLAGLAWRRRCRHAPAAASSYAAHGAWLIAFLRLYGCVDTPGSGSR